VTWNYQRGIGAQVVGLSGRHQKSRKETWNEVMSYGMRYGESHVEVWVTLPSEPEVKWERNAEDIELTIGDDDGSTITVQCEREGLRQVVGGLIAALNELEIWHRTPPEKLPSYEKPPNSEDEQPLPAAARDALESVRNFIEGRKDYRKSALIALDDLAAYLAIARWNTTEE
jgi:hypothetical protein